jgi:hypothetical protein
MSDMEADAYLAGVIPGTYASAVSTVIPPPFLLPLPPQILRPFPRLSSLVVQSPHPYLVAVVL